MRSVRNTWPGPRNQLPSPILEEVHKTQRGRISQVGIDAKYPRVRHFDTKHTSQISGWNLQPIRNAIRFAAERIVGGRSAVGRIVDGLTTNWAFPARNDVVPN